MKSLFEMLILCGLVTAVLNEQQKNLVVHAVGIFAAKGYTHAKIADIAQKAGANIASINYHFQSKENLFVEALRYAFGVANKKYPVSGDFTSKATPESRVRVFAEAILRRSFDEGPAGDFNRIMCNTIHVPGAPIQRILKEVSVLELVTVEHALRDLLGDLPKELIELAKINIINLATVISQKPFVADRILAKNPTEEQIDTFIERQLDIVVSSLAPLIAMKK